MIFGFNLGARTKNLSKQGVAVRLPGITSDSSDFALTRQQIKGLGGVLALLGLLQFLGAYFIAHGVTTHQAQAATQAVAQAQECSNRLNGLGFTSAVKGNMISAEMNAFDEAAYRLGQASIASLSCQGWKLSRFCMGEGCGEKGGVQLELQPAKSN